MVRYERIDHTADLGIRVFGQTPAELFEHAGFALFDCITDITRIAVQEKRSFSLQRDSLEELLVEWLNELLFVYDTEQMLFASFSVTLPTCMSLRATVGGEQYRTGAHVIKKYIKAATYHNLAITCCQGIWQATIVFDV
ncbi:MAG: archease [Desulfobacterota bacterium]|nr:archease [Thermodesulfobacteriota bacterium]